MKVIKLNYCIYVITFIRLIIMTHSFNTSLAKKYRLAEAIILQNLWFWVKKNSESNRNYYNGAFWTYNSIKNYHEIFPYLTDRKISNALKKLEEQGIIQTGNYNKSSYDRTKWYALTEKGLSIMQKCEMENTKSHHPKSNNVSPIPYSNTFNKTVKKPYGIYSHVYLSDSEYESLKSNYSDCEVKIQDLDDYIEMKNVKYPNHYKTITIWAKKKEKSSSIPTINTREIDYDK